MAAAAPKVLLLLRWSSSFGSANNFTGSSKVAIHIPHCCTSTRSKGSLPIRALDRDQEQEDEVDTSNTSGLNSENDLEYLGKVLAGSMVGGAVIKYGSILFPEITRPNIILALTMIFTPVIIATLLLIKQSRTNV